MNTPTLFRSLAALTAVAALAACEDDTVGPVAAMVDADVMSVDFGALDVDFGAGMAQMVTLTNNGSESVMLDAPTVTGSDAAAFMLDGTPGATTLAAGGTLQIALAFDPGSSGAASAQLMVPVTGGDAVMVALTGTGADYDFRQVDRIGIPALNTVFNHPPVFSKVDYNTASPANDLADYTARFETVLGAVANPDPSATAALLLPDALPVSLAGATNFGTLTGRDLADDAVDVALSVTVGIDELKSDNVDSNDVAFLTSFPYLAMPNN